MNARATLSPNSAPVRNAVTSPFVARMLERIARLETSLQGTRLEINHVLDAELGELRAIRTDLLSARDQHAAETTSQTPNQKGGASEVLKSAFFTESASVSHPAVTPVELPSGLEAATMEDLNSALAAVFSQKQA